MKINNINATRRSHRSMFLLHTQRSEHVLCMLQILNGVGLKWSAEEGSTRHLQMRSHPS